MGWQDILKMKISPRLRRYKAVVERTKGYRRANYNSPSYDRFTFEEFVEAIHSDEKLRNGFAALISKSIFEEINTLEPEDPNTFAELPFPSYEVYLQQYGNKIMEDTKADEESEKRSRELRAEKRKDRDAKMRGRRDSKYYAQTLPQPLKTQYEEE